MAVGQIGSSSAGAISSIAGGGAQGAGATTSRPDAAPRLKTTGVTVTLSPEARQHLSRLEGFTATIGTSKQPKQMKQPGISVDLSA